MEDFNIRVRTVAGSKYFHVSPKVTGNKTLYEIWEDDNLLFSLESDDDAADHSLKLTEEYAGKKIYPGFVHAICDVINSSYSTGPVA